MAVIQILNKLFGITVVGTRVDYSKNGGITVNGDIMLKKTITSLATAGAGTLTAAAIVGGVILRDPAGAARTDTTHTAAQLLGAVQGARVGTTFDLFITNSADGNAEDITLVGGTGVTLSPISIVIRRGETSHLKVAFTNITVASEAVTIYHLNANQYNGYFNGNILAAGGNVLEKGTITTEVTASAVTFTPAVLLGGLVLRDPSGVARADLLPTAAAIVAAIPNCVIGTRFRFTIRNTANAAETITLTQDAGATFTVSGTATIAQSNSKEFLVIVTNVSTPAAIAYSLGTVVH